MSAGNPAMPDGTPRPKRHHNPKRPWLVFLVLALVAGLLVAVPALLKPPATEAGGPAPLALERTQVVRGDLIDTVRVQGDLGHGSSRDLGTRLEGTLTSVPTAGTVVSVGGELFRVDDLPVLLMHGKLPAWREFSAGMGEGNDVLQLEESLAALGFFALTPDTRFTAATTTAVKYWQKSLGMKQTGNIELGRIVFSTKDVRIQQAKSKAGSAASGEVVSVTGTGKNIEVFHDTSDRSLARKKTKVQVSLPGGENARGIVVSVGKPVEKEGANGPSRKIPVVVELEDQKAVRDVEDVPVGVQFTAVKARDVIQVPVSALLAQPGGGFAVETGEGPELKLVPVKTGAFANGRVEVIGGGLKPGESVVVAK